MVKRKTNSKELIINLPGVNITELLELEDLLPALRIQLARITYIACIIAQIRVFCIKAKPRQVEALESVNFYIRNGLSKSEPMLYVAAGVALRKTAFKYIDDPDGENLQSDHDDLITNTTGRASTKGGIKVALNSDKRLRENRRGIMLQTVGSLQAATIHNPLKISRDILSINPSNFIESLPFETDGFLDLSDIVEYYSDSFNVRKERDGDIVFVDSLTFPVVPLESPFLGLFTREFPIIPEISDILKDTSKLTSLQQLAAKQLNDLKEG